MTSKLGTGATSQSNADRDAAAVITHHAQLAADLLGHVDTPGTAESAGGCGGVDTQWLQDGPDVWQLRLHRQPVTV